LTPKINNLLEYSKDFKDNINYGLDQLYLEDNYVCDETTFKNNLDKTLENLKIISETGNEKFSQVNEIKDNYHKFLNILREEKNRFIELKYLMQEHEKKVLEDNIDKISLLLDKDLESKRVEINKI